MSSCSVNAELVLDAGCSVDVDGPRGPLHVVEPPRTTLFRQVLGYLEKTPDPPEPSARPHCIDCPLGDSPDSPA